MGVYNLTDGATQPFYNVLADDGSCRYASQGREYFFSSLVIQGVKIVS